MTAPSLLTHAPLPDAAAQWHSSLAVDPAHRLYFDHPLDHLPGLLLLAAMQEMAWRIGSTSRPTYTLQLQARFSQWCHLDHPVQLRGVQLNNQGLELSAWQQERLRCSMQIQLQAGAPPPPAPPGARTLAPCAAAPLNKSHAENVMIAPPEFQGEALRASVLTPSLGHALAGLEPDDLGTLYLLEAFMQTQRYLNHQQSQSHGQRLRDTLCGVSIQLQRRLHRLEPVDIWRPAESRDTAHQGLRQQSAQLRVGAATVGHCSITTLGA